MRITVVGDHDQTIYSFRGAQPGVFNKFTQHMAGCGTVTLTRNYRSTSSIVEASAAVIKPNRHRVDKRVVTSNPPGELVELCECRTVELEHDWVASRLLGLEADGYDLSDVAVLYRTHSVGNALAKHLRELRIPCATSSADVLQRPDVAPLLAALRCVANPDDDDAFRVVARATVPPIPQEALDVALTLDAHAAGASSSRPRATSGRAATRAASRRRRRRRGPRRDRPRGRRRRRPAAAEAEAGAAAAAAAVAVAAARRRRSTRRPSKRSRSPCTRYATSTGARASSRSTRC